MHKHLFAALVAVAIDAGAVTFEMGGLPQTSICQSDGTCRTSFQVGRPVVDGEVFTLRIDSTEPLTGYLLLTPSFSTHVADDLQLRFSYPILAARYQAQAGRTLPDGAFSYFFQGESSASVVATIDFRPGHYLTPSTDPACASLDCMTMRQDEARISGWSLFTSPVPEPATWAMLSIGLLMMLSRPGSRRP